MSPYFKLSSALIFLAITMEALCSPIENTSTSNKDNDKETEHIEISAKPSGISRGALGQGFEIHREDLLSKQFEATGEKIFEDLPMDECTVTTTLGTIERDDSFYNSTESLYQSVASSTKISGSLKGAYTLGVSVAAVTNNIASSEEEVQGLSLNLKAYSMSSILKKNCVNTKPLSKDLVSDFEALDSEITKPWKLSSWKKYKVLLEKYGSHIVKESISGSSIYQYVFAKSNQKFNHRSFTVKACVSLAGPKNASKVGFAGCTGVSQQEIEQSSSQSMIKKLVVRGGKTETRASLIGELDPDQINKFLIEAETDPSPIQYKFEPIWTILKNRYVGTEHFAKAVNLEQFYKGFLHFGCSFLHTSNADNADVEIQKFDFAKTSDPDAPTYVCKVGPEGCQHHEDCHYRAAFWCECGGPYDLARTCLRYKTEKLNSGSTKRECYPNKESGFAWHGCQLHGLSCWCSAPNKNWEETWSGEDTNNALNDVHQVLMEKKRRDQAK
uniref:DELTA-thalatoxin-Avl2a n=1 Tax=Actineria villosa TaxID=227975 RepID=TX60A_ACTVL|nr:RecName: Full=DELTA-thalatoxin-Avl2a; Short=DELTA-TATX-Avl2a; AltName: Full=Toxin AvTX-60A; Short=Av60A; Flags: Precursor [Actineria villosa]BAD04943.1 AvTX-60A [Actineria villosa]